MCCSMVPQVVVSGAHDKAADISGRCQMRCPPLAGELAQVDLPAALAHIREARVAQVAVVRPCRGMTLPT
jgi:hypothetical protein